MELADLLEIERRERSAAPPVRVRCCVAAGCVWQQSHAVMRALEDAVNRAGLADRVKVCGVGCMRLCCEGPLVQTGPDGALYQKVTPENAPSIIDALGEARSGDRAPAQGADHAPAQGADHAPAQGGDHAPAQGPERGDPDGPFFK